MKPKQPSVDAVLMAPKLHSSLWLLVAVTAETWSLMVCSLVLAAVATKLKP